MIQERIIQYIDSKGISKYKFYKITGLSNGFLDKSGTIGVDKCEIIFSFFPDINLEWLITGKGEMLKQEKANLNSVQTVQDKSSAEIIEAQKKTITAQEKTIEIQNENTELYKKVMNMLYDKAFPNRIAPNMFENDSVFQKVVNELEQIGRKQQ